MGKCTPGVHVPKLGTPGLYELDKQMQPSRRRCHCCSCVPSNLE